MSQIKPNPKWHGSNPVSTRPSPTKPGSMVSSEPETMAPKPPSVPRLNIPSKRPDAGSDGQQPTPVFQEHHNALSRQSQDSRHNKEGALPLDAVHKGTREPILYHAQNFRKNEGWTAPNAAQRVVIDAGDFSCGGEEWSGQVQPKAGRRAPLPPPASGGSQTARKASNNENKPPLNDGSVTERTVVRRRKSTPRASKENSGGTPAIDRPKLLESNTSRYFNKIEVKDPEMYGYNNTPHERLAPKFVPIERFDCGSGNPISSRSRMQIFSHHRLIYIHNIISSHSRIVLRVSLVVQHL